MKHSRPGWGLASRRPPDKPAQEPTRLSDGGATNVEEQAAARLLATFVVQRPDDLAVERVWRRLTRRPSRSRGAAPSRVLSLVVPSLAFWSVVALGLFLLRRPAHPAVPSVPGVVGIPVAVPAAAPVQGSAPAPAAELAAARGEVFFSRPTERWQPGEEGQALTEGQSLRTDASGRAVLNIFGIASILIGRDTDVAVERLNGGTYLRLLQGSLVARVSKRPPSEPFVILTHRFSVKVVGTLFQVDQDATDRTRVSVRDGVVDVTGADGHLWRVNAGQSWSSTTPDQIGPAAIPDSIETLLEDGLNRVSPLQLDRELGVVEDSSAGASLQPPKPMTEPLPSRRGAAVLPKPLTPPPVLLATREPSPPPAQVPVPEAYANGVALERAGKYQAAAAEFVAAEKSDPGRADLALYALGRLRQHRLREPQGALEAFETYRRTYPNGALLPEVDLAVLEIEAAAGHRDRALAESVRFLASHPASERLPEVRLLRGDLLRERNDWIAALAEYRQVTGAAFAEDALYETAYCQRKLGDAAGARESLQQYRQRYPTGIHRDEVAKVLGE